VFTSSHQEETTRPTRQNAILGEITKRFVKTKKGMGGRRVWNNGQETNLSVIVGSSFEKNVKGEKKRRGWMDRE